MGFLAFFNCYTLRVNLSVAIVAMVNATHLRQLDDAAAVPRPNDSSNASAAVSTYRFDDICVDSDDNATNVLDKKVRV